jgi:hypothetical protein
MLIFALLGILRGRRFASVVSYGIPMPVIASFGIVCWSRDGRRRYARCGGSQCIIVWSKSGLVSFLDAVRLDQVGGVLVTLYWVGLGWNRIG